MLKRQSIHDNEISFITIRLGLLNKDFGEVSECEAALRHSQVKVDGRSYGIG